MLESVGSFIGADVAKGLSQDINELEIKTGPSDRLFFALLNREIELGVLSSPVLSDDSLAWDFLFEEPWVLIFPRGFEIPSPLTWQVLSKLELSFVPVWEKYGKQQNNLNVFDRLSLRFSTRYKVEDTNMILKFVKAGLGWGLVQPYAVSSLVGLGEVTIVKAPSPISRRKVFLVSRNSFDKELLGTVKNLLIHLMQEKIKAELCPIIPLDFKRVFICRVRQKQKRASGFRTEAGASLWISKSWNKNRKKGVFLKLNNVLFFLEGVNDRCHCMRICHQHWINQLLRFFFSHQTHFNNGFP